MAKLRRLFPIPKGLAAILAAYLLAASLFNLMHPLWEAPDEANHYAFVRSLADRRALPEVVPFWADRLGGETEAHQPPLYYAIEALLVGWVDDGTHADWHRNPFVTWPDHPARLAIALHRQEEAFPYRGYVLGVHLARLVSSLLGAATVLVTYLLARRLTGRQNTALLAAALAAFTPGFTFISATVNNDNGVTLTWALVLWRERWRAGRVLRAAAPLPLASLVLTGWWPLVMRDEWPLIVANADMNVPAGGLVPPPGGYNLELVGRGLVLMFRAYWGQFGWADELLLPEWVCAIAGLVCLMAAWGWVRRWRRPGWRAADAVPLGLVSLFALGLAFVVFNRYQLAPYGQVMQGRYLYLAMPVIATLLAVGLNEVTGRRLLVTALPVAILAAITFAVPFTLSRDSFVPPYPVWGTFDESRVARRVGLPYANGATYLGLTAENADLRPGEAFAFTSYWRADADLTSDMLAAFRLVDPMGEANVSDHRRPREQTLPPRLWQRGEVVPDPRRLTLPANALPGAYRLQMRLLGETGIVDVPLRAGDGARTGWFDVADLRVRPLGQGKPGVTLPAEAVFGGELALAGYDLERDTTGAEGTLAVTLYWRAVAVPRADYHVSLQVQDADGRLWAQHDGPPYGGGYPTRLWQAGELVPDRHVVSLPEGSGTLGKVMVVVYRPGDGQRLEVAGASAFELLRLAESR